ncbi:D-alanine--D-alanine ligase [Candidatus Contubernalis alkaliaceticus]|uniref:D-alanine--D-alanine ligase n=1 Tax=Candidatus Contubernalis alkaliaceticus TaxID=338645 RepID=UPI001F4C23A5|nr:D-alanine--D-alanine ligase [Candidatus Contubernalis alkalaceticus]UNC90630.1 D-alanine--D-alanine ligase [Candidatus Contubernalis alkalaceticus]
MRLRVGVLFGGRSGEHEVSLKSARSVMDALDKTKYDIVPIGITKEGTWLAGADPMEALATGDIPGENYPVAIVPDPGVGGMISIEEPTVLGKIEKLQVVFPVLHGTNGEDGTVQGLLELAGIPYVGPGVLAASAGMDKVVMKMLFERCGLPVGKYLYFLKKEWTENQERIIKEIEEVLGYPCFIKPANLGSSVGISKANNREKLILGIEDAARYDRKIVVEEHLQGKEIEVSVLGNDDPEASVPGEIIPSNDFYDYHAKYVDNRSELIIPADLGEKLTKEVQSLAVKVFKAIDGSGMGRVDFFVDPQKETVLVNEINTIPGFTQISMYPKLWEATGLSYSGLLERLIDLALERFEEKAELKTIF